MGFFYALVSALCQSFHGIVEKVAVQRLSPLTIALSVSVFELVVLAWLIVFGGVWSVSFSRLFVVWVFVIAAINSYTRYSVPRALYFSDVGLIIPMFAYVPVFTVVLWLVFLGEVPSWYALGWIVLVVVGSMLLHGVWKGHRFSSVLLSPLHDRWCRLMLLNTFLWSCANIVTKRTLGDSNVWTFLFCMSVLITVILTCKHFFSGQSFPSLQKLSLIPVLWWLNLWSYACMLLAYDYIFVAYVSSIKRLSAVFSVFLAWRLLKEKNIWPKLLGSLVMCWGVALLMVLG